MYLSFEKCEFNRQRIKCLKLVILKDQVEIDSIKIAGIYDWSILQSRIDM